MKNVEDYLNEGIYGTHRPKEAERDYYLGTLRERIVLVLTKGQVMTDKALEQLENAIQEHPGAKLLFNGHIPSHFYQREQAIAEKHNVPYSSILNAEAENSDIGAILTYDYAIDKEDIFIRDEDLQAASTKKEQPTSLWGKLKNWFFPPV